MGMETALISIVIPSYNRCQLLQRCIKNLKKQTYPNIEIIIVDDGSQDDTETVMKRYPDSNIHYYRYTPNRGACYARNFGIQKAHGKYIAFQDSDDFWRPEKLAEQMKFLVRTQADMVFCGMYRYEQNGKSASYYPKKRLDSQKDIFQQLLKENRISTQTILAKRSIFDKVMFDPTLRRFQDWDIALQIAKSGYKIEYIPKPLVISEIQLNSISATVKSEESYRCILNKYEEDYKKNPKAYAAILRDLAQSLKTTEKKKAVRYFEMSLKCHFSLRLLIKLCMFKIHIEM